MYCISGGILQLFIAHLSNSISKTFLLLQLALWCIKSSLCQYPWIKYKIHFELEHYIYCGVDMSHLPAAKLKLTFSFEAIFKHISLLIINSTGATKLSDG